MYTVVVFSCGSPELVQSEPYNEKADIWAAGCVLYQMATLKPPFHSKNLLALAKKVIQWNWSHRAIFWLHYNIIDVCR